MKIGIDGHVLGIPFPCGSKHYGEQLLTSLGEIDKKNQYLIFSKKRVEIPNQKNFRLIKIPNLLPIFKRQFLLTFYAKKADVDVFHYLEPVGSVFHNNLKIVTTVHDLNLSYTYPLTKYPANRISGEIIRYFTFKKTVAFITDTKYIQLELKAFLSKIGKKSNIKMIPLSQDKIFRNHHLPRQKYFLAMGDFAWRKNVPGVIKAYSLLPEKIRETFKLNIVTSTPSAKSKFMDLARARVKPSNVVFYENVSQEKLIEMYNQAAVFLYPSFYEGFGLPILEAMACGCPVITSNRGATKETAGKAALLVNPKSTREIARAMIKVVKNSKLSKSLFKKGIKRASEFSWEKTARETLKVYQEVAHGK